MTQPCLKRTKFCRQCRVATPSGKFGNSKRPFPFRGKWLEWGKDCLSKKGKLRKDLEKLGKRMIIKKTKKNLKKKKNKISGRVRREWDETGNPVIIFRPSATKSGRPYGVTSASSSLSWRTPLPPLADPPPWWMVGALSLYADEAYLFSKWEVPRGTMGPSCACSKGKCFPKNLRRILGWGGFHLQHHTRIVRKMEIRKARLPNFMPAKSLSRTILGLRSWQASCGLLFLNRGRLSPQF